MVALTIERTEWDGALALWDGYLSAAIAAGILPPSGPETARVLLHMAALFPEDPEETLDSVGVKSEAEMRALIRRGELPACFDRGALLERARAADPDPQVFRALVAHYAQREPKRAEMEAEAWRRTHPQELEPLLHLIRAAEGRGAIRKALALLAEAEAIDRVHPEVRQARFRLLLAGAERRIKEGKPALALRDLDLLEQEPRAGEGDHRAYLLALRWTAASCAGDAPAATGLEQQLMATLGNPVAYELILGVAANAVGVKAPRPSMPAEPPQVIEGLARALDLFRALKRPLRVPAALLARVEAALPTASMAQLYSLCAGGLWIEQPALTYAASGRGLAQDGPLLHRFLLARGQALTSGMTPAEHERARDCLLAARELAARARDLDAVREAAAALASLRSKPDVDPWMWSDPAPSDEPPTQEEILRIIAAERRRQPAPALFAGKASPRRRRARSSRRDELHGLMDALMMWVEERL
jgi:hypothetical protein